jgi:WD40 repeat protein
VLATAATTPDKKYPIKLWKAGSKEELASLEGHSAPISRIALSSNGALLASTVPGEIKIWDVRAKSLRHTFTLRGDKRQSLGRLLLAFDSSGKNVLSTAEKAFVKVNTETGEGAAFEAPVGAPGAAVAYAPQTNELAVSVLVSLEPRSIELWLYDADTLARQQPIKLGEGLPGVVALSADGRTVAVGFAEGFIEVYDTKSRALRGKLERLIGPPPILFERMVLNSDGSALVGFANRVPTPAAQRWMVGHGKPVGIQLGSDYKTHDVTFSPDGKTILVSVLGKFLRYFDTVSGEDQTP